MPRETVERQCSTTLAERDGQLRSRSTSSSPRRKQHTSISTPENSGPQASSASRTRCREAITTSVISLPLLPQLRVRATPDQLEVTRGDKCPRVKSARSFSPAMN